MNEAPVRAASCVYFYNVELGPPLIYNVLAIHTNLKLGIDVKNIYNMSLYIVYAQYSLFSHVSLIFVFLVTRSSLSFSSSACSL